MKPGGTLMRRRLISPNVTASRWRQIASSGRLGPAQLFKVLVGLFPVVSLVQEAQGQVDLLDTHPLHQAQYGRLRQ
jgi:hypothetical protein